MMTKSDTIEAIKKLNPTASPDFLAGFSADDLSQYLKRLGGQSPHEIDKPDDIMVREPIPERASPVDLVHG